MREENAGRLTPEGQRYLERIQAATQRMNEQIEAMLGLSRVMQRSLNCTPVYLSSMAWAVAAELQQREPARPVDWRITPGLWTRADPHLMRVVLENLLDNAWKFTSQQPQAYIEFSVAPSSTVEGATLFCVRDNGAGFDPAQAHRLFGPFQRLHTDDEFPGTGVGLATVQRIVQRHGGRIWAEARVGRGAAFYFTLGQGQSSQAND
jgi:signal transduction histidine kinase